MFNLPGAAQSFCSVFLFCFFFFVMHVLFSCFYVIPVQKPHACSRGPNILDICTFPTQICLETVTATHIRPKNGITHLEVASRELHGDGIAVSLRGPRGTCGYGDKVHGLTAGMDVANYTGSQRGWARAVQCTP